MQEPRRYCHFGKKIYLPRRPKMGLGRYWGDARRSEIFRDDEMILRTQNYVLPKL